MPESTEVPLADFVEEDKLDILAEVYAFIIERTEQIRAQNESQESA